MRRVIGWALGGTAALFLVGRGVAEFFVIDYANPASYHDSWGGPSLAGVFLVHSGPGAAIVIVAALYAVRRWRRAYPAPSAKRTRR
jgi:hypothetical protein